MRRPRGCASSWPWICRSFSRHRRGPCASPRQFDFLHHVQILSGVLLLGAAADWPLRPYAVFMTEESKSNGRRVAVTGMGFITPIGIDMETVWSNLVEGVSGVGRITRFDTTHFDTKIAAEVKTFNPEEYMD